MPNPRISVGVKKSFTCAEIHYLAVGRIRCEAGDGNVAEEIVDLRPDRRGSRDVVVFHNPPPTLPAQTFFLVASLGSTSKARVRPPILLGSSFRPADIGKRGLCLVSVLWNPPQFLGILISLDQPFPGNRLCNKVFGNFLLLLHRKIHAVLQGYAALFLFTVSFRRAPKNNPATA
jgi:hypothetical protein